MANWETFKAVDNNITVIPNEVQKQTFPMIVAERARMLALFCIAKDYKRNSRFLQSVYVARAMDSVNVLEPDGRDSNDTVLQNL